MAMSRSLGATSLTTRSPMRIWPSVIGSSPATIRRAVVLPQPDGPTRTIRLPSSTSSDRSSTATVPSSNTLVTWSNTISAMPSALLADPERPAGEPDHGHVVAARALQDEHQRPGRGLGQGGAVPHGPVHDHPGPRRDPEHPEPVGAGQAGRLLGVVGRGHVHQQVGRGGEHRLLGPEVPLGPVEGPVGRPQVEVPDPERPAVAGQVGGLGPPPPARPGGVLGPLRQLDHPPVGGEGLGRQRLHRQPDHSAASTSRGRPASPDGRGTALSRLAGVLATRRARSLAPGRSSPVTSTRYGSQSRTPARWPFTSTSRTSSRIGTSRSSRLPARSSGTSTVVRYRPRPE